MLLYALLHLIGFEGVTIDEIKRFRQLGSKTPGHPENFMTPGIETTTGPLGQGLGNAVGMAIAERISRPSSGDDVVDHRTYVLASDGDLMEGISQEAIALAGHLKLDKLIVLFDDNGISIDGPLSLVELGRPGRSASRPPAGARRAIDGHDPEAIAAAIEAAQRHPTGRRMIACSTTIGYGAPTKAGTRRSHGSPLGADEIKGAREKLGWSDAAVRNPGRRSCTPGAQAGQRGRRARKAWGKRLAALARRQARRVRAPHRRRAAGRGSPTPSRELKEKLAAEPKEIATRKASRDRARALVTAAVPEMIGGSADLTGSNNTTHQEP